MANRVAVIRYGTDRHIGTRLNPADEVSRGLKKRVVPDLPAFTNVEVDYFGPVEVKKGCGRVKHCGVLFTCIAIRVVHLLTWILTWLLRL